MIVNMKMPIAIYNYFLNNFSVMRLGKKKEKSGEAEVAQTVDGIARLICSAKSSHTPPLKGKL